MFEHVRADLQAQVSTAKVGVQQALAAQDAARQDVERQSQQLPPLQQALALAQGNLQQANAVLATAQAAADQRQQARDAAQSARDAAAQALDEHTGQEPDPTGNGKPNPAHGPWAREQVRLQRVLNSAQTALDSANAALVQAQQPRDAAANNVRAATASVNTAENQIAAATTNVNAAQQRYNAAEAAVSTAQQAEAQLNTELAVLDPRAARLVAMPLNRADLEPAADAELNDVLDRRHRRHDLLVQRAGVLADRVFRLAAQDVTTDSADALRREIAAWSDVNRYRSLASAMASINGVVAASQAQRTRPPRQRSDDLQAVSAQLHSALSDLQAALQQANTERETADAAVRQAAQDLANHQQARP